MRVDISSAQRLLEEGHIVGIPTETVYGLAADALNPDAVVKIFAAKNRPAFNPLICHLASKEAVFRLGKSNPNAERLAEFWPGPLTLLLKHEGRIPSIVTSGSEYCAFRVPAHSIALELLSQTGPLAAPSANKSGQVSPVRAEMVERAFGMDFPVLDGGPCVIGLESTICLPDENGVRILRSGAVSIEEIVAAGIPVIDPADSQAIVAPGQSLSHYAPTVPLVLIDPISAHATDNWKPSGISASNRATLDFGKALDLEANLRLNLSPTADLHEAARNLFFYFDLPGASNIRLLVAGIVPEQGIGRAINDRLRRAANFLGKIENGILLVRERS
ncbi:MAG: threonylcarbamoyl-AMP synthase [Spirochaetia bacterium]|nr:threonylcarbamoyl-AMP synthase [Spirochaetia bacterium]